MNVENMSNRELLENYSEMVRYYHYDPTGTPERVKLMLEAGMSEDSLFDAVLKRMKP